MDQENKESQECEPGRVTLAIEADPTTGYAAIQNNVPIVRSISLTNASEVELRDVELIVSCLPAFARGVRLRFERLVPGESRRIAPLDLQPDHGYLSRLDEAELASITVGVTSEGNLAGEGHQQINVLAYDQWAGTRCLPELLAAFCMPNSRVVDQLIGKASALLRTGVSGLSMSGYQNKNREHVWKQVSSIYSTLCGEEIHYSNPPASFGTDGQKIRTPERILDGRVATCLDLAMLFASCIEQVGLHPVVLFKEGHAWVGCWLVETCFPTAVVDDVQAVRKRVQSGELMVFETTGICEQAKPSLRWACSTGEEHFNDEGKFQFAVDISRARQSQIRALPSRSAIATEIPQGEPVGRIPAIEDMPALPPLDPALLPISQAPGDETPEGRLAKWKSKLLDLTLRNRLLNFKPTKSNLRVLAPNLAALEDALAEGKEFHIRPLPQVMEGADPRDAAVFIARSGKSALEAFAEDALARRELIADVQESALDGRLVEIFRAASLGLEEGGANTLFLVFGLLEWREEKDAEASHLAPILLVPVTLTRQSVRSGFRLARHDDDAMVNPTLIQKLWQDFSLRLPSFEALPMDEKGIDIGAILQTFRIHVADIKGWEVKEQVHLGIFSFTKYLMWKDLQDRTEQLQQNRVVAHLINNPGKAFADGELAFDPATLDDTHRPQDLFAPLLSDSSQLRAICVASQGRDLVLEGPPGTGKSQTITNLIAHSLAAGKTVLFVSEKMAALEVVHRRIASLGLGPFCLELHSAKARKADVLKQLGAALDAAGARTVKDWEREAERLAALRQELNAVVRALHTEHANDLTIHGAIGTCIRFGQWIPAQMGWADPNTHSRAELEALREIARQMAALASQLTNISAHPLAAIARGEWSPSWQEDLLQAAQDLAAAAGDLQEVAAPMMKLFGLFEQGASLEDLAALDRLADVMLLAPKIPVGIAKCAHDECIRARLRVLRQHGSERKQAWEALGGVYRGELAQVSASELSLAWAAARTTWWPRNWFAKRSVSGRLRLYRTDQRRPADNEIPSLLDSLAKVNEEDRALVAMSGEATALLQNGYSGEKTDWEAVASYERWAEGFSDAVTAMAGTDAEVLESLRARLAPFVGENRAMLAPNGPVGSGLMRLRDAYREFLTRLGRVEEMADAGGRLIESRAASAAIQRLLGVLQGWQLAHRQIQAWCLWRRARAKAIGQGLQGLVGAIESGQIPLGDIADFFEYSYQNWWVKKAIDREPVLCTFASVDHERKIREFREADERFQRLTQQYIVARLSGQIPASTVLSPGADSEMGRLRRELQKQKRHMPIRTLIHGLPTLLQKLKPCLLMSPLSVAQYLEAGHAQFDLVVFDEASQIPVWDSVGAIARGRMLVCVGDPKQLPPTNFFNRADDPDAPGATEDDVQDLESILDECLGSGLPKLSLEWHYRSKHESLIAFSNATYYEGKLVTFPSPVTEDMAVRFEHIHGVYDRGGSRTNRAEANAIVDGIEKHYLDPERRQQSLGVVTFNQAQQNLIENLLDARRRASTKLDQAIAQVSFEPLFIKNLENVQGDERDFIFFSVTYGPDASGRVTLNFGPLNLEGGHRRLNVAISRARQGVVIFSTLLPEHIDLSRVSAAGVRDLKNYLEFAIRGPRALVEQSMPTGREPESPFEQAVIHALRDKGWVVHPQVGVSGYRIDIGVVDSRAPGRYLLGIECDGRSYHSGATARDRDRLRQHVLEGLGWHLHRIWSTDWWLNAPEQLARLQARLEEMLSSDVEEQAPVAQDGGANEEVGDDAGVPEALAMPAYARMMADDSASPSAPVGLPEYRVATVRGGLPDAFYLDTSSAELERQLLEVIEAEGPIADALLYERIARAWRLKRTGKRIGERLKGLVPSHVRKTWDDERLVYWPRTADPDSWEGFRVAGEDSASRRDIDFVCPEELASIAIYVLTHTGATTREDLARQVCRLLGILRTTADTERRVVKALSCGRGRLLVTTDDGSISLLRV